MHISLIGLLVAGEVFLLLLVALIALLLVNMIRRRRDRQAALYLVSIVKEAEGKRLDETRSLLEAKYGYKDEALVNTAHNIMQAEKLLYQRIINMYVKRDVISLRELNIDVEAVTEPFRTLALAEITAPAHAPQSDQVGGDEAERLSRENAALKQELQITMETMSRMLGEYASMFGGGPQAQVQSDTMQQVLEADDGTEALNNGFDADMAFDIGAADDEQLESVEALGDLALDQGGDVSQTPATADDATVMLDAGTDLEALDDDAFSSTSGEDDLSFDQFDSVFDAADEQAAASEPVTSDGEEPMDDELADIWADALAEQDDAEKK
jgi:hypothetical protein